MVDEDNLEESNGNWNRKLMNIGQQKNVRKWKEWVNIEETDLHINEENQQEVINLIRLIHHV